MEYTQLLLISKMIHSSLIYLKILFLMISNLIFPILIHYTFEYKNFFKLWLLMEIKIYSIE